MGIPGFYTYLVSNFASVRRPLNSQEHRDKSQEHDKLRELHNEAIQEDAITIDNLYLDLNGIVRILK
jgi:5'-3' exonuclease